MSEFLAEARVLIRPDTTGFRSLLQAELLTATRGITVPVPVTAVAATGSVTAAQQVAGANAVVAKSALTASAATANLTATFKANAASAIRLAGIEEAMSVTTTALAASRARLRELNAATAASEIALARAVAGGNATLVAAQLTITNRVRLLRALAMADVQAAIAEGKLASAMANRARAEGFVARGAGATALSLLGVRGATLAANSAFLAGAASVAAFAKSIQLAAGLETSLNTFRVTVGATADEMEQAREQAKLLGRDITLPGVAAQDAAETFLTLARAGLTVRDAFAGARGVLQLATAAEIENAEASRLVASALNAFGLSGQAAVDVADTLTNAANASQASISEMGIALQQSAAIADLAGLSFGETVTFLTQLAKAGLAGSDAGTSFRVAIQRLIAPTDEARKRLDALRINLRDVQGNLRPEAFFELAEALQRQGRAQADATRQIIFGNDASRAAAFFARLNAKTFRDQERELARSGAAAEVAGAKTEGFAGSAENLKNQLSALGTELGELGLPVIGAAADAAALAFGELASAIADQREGFRDLGTIVRLAGEDLRRFADETGFGQFLLDASEDTHTLVESIQDASNATDAFLADLLGIGGQAESTAPRIRKLSDEEKRLAEQITDVHDRADLQVTDFGRIATAAERAAGSIKRLTGQIAGIEDQITQARIAGDQGAELDLLEQERKRLQRLIAIEERIVAEGGRGAATARERIRNELRPQLETITNEIKGVLADQASASRRVADEAQQARDERDRNFLQAIGQEEQKKINAVIRAESTESTKDDIKTNVELRNFYRRQIIEIEKTVRDANLAAQAIASATADLIRADQAIKDARRAAREKRREERERLIESTELDIELAQITGNRAREIALRRQLIKQLQDRIKHEQGNTILIKQLRNEIARQKKAIDEAKGEQEKKGNAFKELTFEFLQTQQGFAANLFGNLIPGGSTGGLVGNISAPTPQVTPGAGIQQEAAVAAGRDLGFSRGQGNETNQLLRAILRALENLNGRAGHPEARHQRSTMGAFMDVIGT